MVRHSWSPWTVALWVGRHVVAFVTFWIIGFTFVQFGVRVLGGWPASEVGQLLSCVLGVGIALRMRAPVIAYFVAAMAAFSASELLIHLAYGLQNVQGAPAHFAVMGSGISGVALGALLMMLGRRRGRGFGAAAANGIPSHNVAADADDAEASTSERRSNVAYDLGNELRFPDAFSRLLRCDRFRGPAREREVVDRHAPSLALVHHIEPPGMIAARACATTLLLADLSYSHRSDLSYSHRSSFRLRDSCRGSSTNPVEDVCGMKPPSSDAEPLRGDQAAEVRASDRLFVAADELGHLERVHQPVRQPVSRSRLTVDELRVGRSIHRIRVRVLSHRSPPAPLAPKVSVPIWWLNESSRRWRRRDDRPVRRITCVAGSTSGIRIGVGDRDPIDRNGETVDARLGERCIDPPRWRCGRLLV